MHALTRLIAAGLCAAAAASAVQAQVRSLTSRPNTAAQAATAQTNRTAPAPAGLRPIFPAGISSGSGAAVSGDPIAASNSPIPPGTTTVTNSDGTTTVVTGVAGGATIVPEIPSPATNVLGAGPAVIGSGATVRGPGQVVAGAGGFSAMDIARSFFFADANKDGELTRAEAARLSIATMPFEEMDRNFDGIISRFEYEDTVR